MENGSLITGKIPLKKLKFFLNHFSPWKKNEQTILKIMCNEKSLGQTLKYFFKCIDRFLHDMIGILNFHSIGFFIFFLYIMENCTNFMFKFRQFFIKNDSECGFLNGIKLNKNTNHFSSFLISLNIIVSHQNVFKKSFDARVIN